jgi:hypothetical protein
MMRCLRTSLLFATVIAILPPDAHAGVKSGASIHPMIAPKIHPLHTHPGFARTRGHPHAARAVHGKHLHGFDKFSRHHRNRFVGWGFPFDGSGYYGSYYEPYGSYYDPADESGDFDSATLSGYGPFPGSSPRRAFYRTGCQSEAVSVPSAHGPTSVTVTRCSVPMPELPLK